jgi:hypothetical protein
VPRWKFPVPRLYYRVQIRRLALAGQLKQIKYPVPRLYYRVQIRRLALAEQQKQIKYSLV